MQPIKNTLRSCLLACAILLSAVGPIAACPNCKEGMNSQEPHKNNLARGYGYSVMFMLSMPPTVLAIFGLGIYRECVKAKREREQVVVDPQAE